MKLTNKQILESRVAIQKVLNNDLSVRTQFKLNKNVAELNNIISIYEDSRQKIIEKYCDKDEEGKPIIENNCFTFRKKNEEFNKDFNDLNSIENEINIEKLTLDELEDVKLNNAEFNSIKFLIKE